MFATVCLKLIWFKNKRREDSLKRRRSFITSKALFRHLEIAPIVLAFITGNGFSADKEIELIFVFPLRFGVNLTGDSV